MDESLDPASDGGVDHRRFEELGQTRGVCETDLAGLFGRVAVVAEGRGETGAIVVRPRRGKMREAGILDLLARGPVDPGVDLRGDGLRDDEDPAPHRLDPSEGCCGKVIGKKGMDADGN